MALEIRRGSSPPRPVPTPWNNFVLFEGSRVRHRVTPLLAGERRVMLSMTFRTDTASTRARAVQRRIKDTAYYGIRTLWN